MRELSASPSGSRTVGQTSIRTGMSRSRTSLRITSACWASFWPKYATSGPTMLNSFVTTVVTPSKCSGAALARPFEHLGEAADRDRRVEAVGIDLLDRRREQEVHALGLGELGVALLVARVRVEVLAGAELGGVHEQRDHDDVVPPRAAA